MIKRILINAVLILILAAVLEFVSFLSTSREISEFKKMTDMHKSNNTAEYKTQYTLLKDYNPKIYRKSFISENTAESPVILFGCSFAEGAGLEDKDTPCSRLHKLTGRSCINKSKGASGVQLMYYQLKDENFYKENPKADYVIYIFIHDHLKRLYNYQPNPFIDAFNLRYKLKRGRIEEIKHADFLRPFYSLFFVRKFMKAEMLRKSAKEASDFKLFNALMRENARLIKEHYPNAKFIMLEYPERTGRLLPRKELEKLADMGIITVRVSDLINDIDINEQKYRLDDNIHPSNAAWDIIMPRFAAAVKNL